MSDRGVGSKAAGAAAAAILGSVVGLTGTKAVKKRAGILPATVIGGASAIGSAFVPAGWVRDGMLGAAGGGMSVLGASLDEVIEKLRDDEDGAGDEPAEEQERGLDVPDE